MLTKNQVPFVLVKVEWHGHRISHVPSVVPGYLTHVKYSEVTFYIIGDRVSFWLSADRLFDKIYLPRVNVVN